MRRTLYILAALGLAAALAYFVGRGTPPGSGTPQTGPPVEDATGRFTFGSRPGVLAADADRPVRVKLKRTATGSYTWELDGDDVAKVVEADRALRRYMDGETTQP
jgi:hypothetical protein